MLMKSPKHLIELKEEWQSYSILVSPTFLPSHFELLQSRLDFPLVTNQVEFNVMQFDPMEDGTFDLMQQKTGITNDMVTFGRRKNF
jgi:predicted oxidoreductase